MFKYDFALSFAGEHREEAEQLAKLLQRERVRVFYDKDEQADLWGQDLSQRFQQIYGQESRFFEVLPIPRTVESTRFAG